MPRRNPLCSCKVCRHTIRRSHRTINDHIKKYGRSEDRDELDRGSGEFELVTVPNYEPSSSMDADHSIERKVQKFMAPPESPESSVKDGPECSISKQQDEQSYEFEEESTDEDTYMASSDDEDRPDSSSQEEEEFSQKGITDRLLHYDQEIYSSGIAVEKMYGDSSSISVLQWLAMQFHLFSTHPAMSKEMFSNNLKLNGFVNSHLKPRPAISIPTSYKEARRMIDPYVLKKQVCYSCVNDCMIFELEDTKTPCNFCGTQDRKRFLYLPIGPRLARYFGEQNLAKLLQVHTTREECTNSDMWDLHDSSAWKEIYSLQGFFGGSKNGISFAFEVDGVNPFHNVGVQYSMTPMMLTLLNLPRQIRNAFGNIMLVGIIPGSGRSEATKLDPYINVMVDEMLQLTECTIIDSYMNAPTHVKIKLLFYVMDYPGLSKVFNQQGSGGLSACHWCHLQGEYSTELSKVIYPSNFLYLSPDDPLHKHGINESSNSMHKSGFRMSHEPRGRDVSLENSSRRAYENSKSKLNRMLVASATGCKGHYALEKLPGHNRIEETQPGACHTIKDVVQNVMKLLTNKGLDIEKIERAENGYGRTVVDNEPDKRLNDMKGKRKKEQRILKYVLTASELKKADERACSIRTPLDFGLKPSPFISKSSCLKSHDWKQLACHGVLKFCLRGFLASECRETLFNLFDIMALLCEEHQCSDDLSSMEIKVNRALVLLERDFPLSLQNITTHILHHIVQGIHNFGPVYSTWMFVYERFNSWLCKRTLNMRHPESTAVETYIVFDWCQFMINSGKMPRGFSDQFCPDNDMAYTGIDTIGMECDEHPDNISGSFAGKEYTPSKREFRAIHRVCRTCSSNGQNCEIKKKGQITVVHTPTGRQISYTSIKSKRHGAKTDSSYVCFEDSRGQQKQKVESGKFLYFAQILYFISHKNIMSSSVEVVVKRLVGEYDSESGLWFCRTRSRHSAKMSTLEVKDLSNPLVTAEEDDMLWFLNANKKPYCGLAS